MTDLFNDQTDPQSNSDKNSPAPHQSVGDHLAELVGEGKKFKTVEDLAKSKKEADAFIEQLKQEGAEMRRQLTEMEKQQGKARTIDDVMNAIDRVRGDDGNQSAISAEDILKAIDHRVAEHDRQKQRRANFEIAQSELLKKFNNDEMKAKEFIRAEASRVGLTPSELKSLSETSPEAFKRILGLTNPTGPNSTSFTTEVNTEARTTTGAVRNAAYYSELRKQLGARFYDASIQQQRFKDARALGPKFYE